MTADEIQALRRKHCICTCGYCGNNECEAGCVGEYPCDAIKVLDYLEVVGQAYEHAKAMGAKMTALFAQSLDELVAIRGSTTDQISCDTEQTEERNECDHLWLAKAGTAYRFKFVEVCAKCGGKL